MRKSSLIDPRNIKTLRWNDETERYDIVFREGSSEHKASVKQFKVENARVSLEDVPGSPRPPHEQGSAPGNERRSEDHKDGREGEARVAKARGSI
jgi:hypothetical protein